VALPNTAAPCAAPTLIDLAKFACGAFADTSFVAARQRRDFAGLSMDF
jgi:hypothetical protein